MKKRLLTLALLSLAALSLAACQKNCVCYGYDELEHEFSEEDVDAHGGNCANMRNYPVDNHYSVCNWK